jgi:hypothetical protein
MRPLELCAATTCLVNWSMPSAIVSYIPLWWSSSFASRAVQHYHLQICGLRCWCRLAGAGLRAAAEGTPLSGGTPPWPSLPPPSPPLTASEGWMPGEALVAVIFCCGTQVLHPSRTCHGRCALQPRHGT